MEYWVVIRLMLGELKIDSSNEKMKGFMRKKWLSIEVKVIKKE